MEYRCRLGTTSGEIIEGVYVAQSEAALRRELEDKGLHVLSLKPRLGLGGINLGESVLLPLPLAGEGWGEGKGPSMWPCACFDPATTLTPTLSRQREREQVGSADLAR